MQRKDGTSGMKRSLRGERWGVLDGVGKIFRTPSGFTTDCNLLGGGGFVDDLFMTGLYRSPCPGLLWRKEMEGELWSYFCRFPISILLALMTLFWCSISFKGWSVSGCTVDFPEIRNSSRSFWSSSVSNSGRKESVRSREASDPWEATGGEHEPAGDGSPRDTAGEEAAEGTTAGLTGLFRDSQWRMDPSTVRDLIISTKMFMLSWTAMNLSTLVSSPANIFCYSYHLGCFRNLAF